METLLWGLKKNSQQLKDIIIRVLSDTYPLTAKQLHKKITQSYRSGVSYQAVHQIANELVEQSILIKIKTEYMINIDWLNNLSDFAHCVKNFYLNKTKVNLPEEAPKSVLNILEKYKEQITEKYDQLKDNPFLEVSPSLLADFNTRETLGTKRNILNVLRDNQTNSFLLIGDSGSGKSTMLKMIAYEYVSRGKLIPIYYKLSQYQGESLIDIIKEQIERFTKEEVRTDMIKILLSEGAFIFLFDGLNEVSGQLRVDYALMDKLDLAIDNLNKFIRNANYKKNLFLISCRSYNDPKRRLPITTYKLNPLNEKQIQLILKKENVKLKVKDHSLCRNPLMLSMLIKSGKYNIKKETQLYEYFISNLLDENNEAIDILSKLAYQLNFLCFNLPYSEIYHLLEKITTNEMVELLFESNILQKENGGCEFMQKSIQEYLAAKELKRKNFTKKAWLEIIKNKNWHASLLFYASMEKEISKLLQVMYEQFILTGDHDLLFLATHCLIENGKTEGELFKKIMNSLLNIYNYKDEVFYLYWYELNHIFSKWNKTAVNNKIINHFNNLDTEISARMTNILFHAKNVNYSKNKKLFTKIILSSDNPHLQYSLIELIGIYKLEEFVSLIFPKIKSSDPILSAVTIWALEQTEYEHEEIESIKPNLFERISKLIEEAKEDYIVGHCMIELARLDYNRAVPIIFKHLNNKTIIKYHGCYALSREERVDMSQIFEKVWSNKLNEVRNMLRVST